MSNPDVDEILPNVPWCNALLQMILDQFLYSLNSCSPATLLKVGGAYPEMAAQEKAVDMFVELLKKDQVCCELVLSSV